MFLLQVFYGYMMKILSADQEKRICLAYKNRKAFIKTVILICI
jgi:hypothetical protein